MITKQIWATRFPQFFQVSAELFNILKDDAIVEMGVDEDRWAGAYDVALSNLVAHFYVVHQQQVLGDSNALAPLRRTEVEDVVVELAMPREVGSTSLLYENYASTSYGQAYAKYRRMAFGGPRSVSP